MTVKRALGELFLFAITSGCVFGSTIDWTNWQTQPTSTSANGTLLVGSTPVTVSYSGEIAFTQLNGTGTDYFLPSTTFTAPPTVPNAPPSDMIAIDGTATTHTITFSSAVVNPIMEIVSLGQPGFGTQYDFSLGAGQSMSILNQGPSNNFGGCNTCLSLSGSNITGTEGDGVIQFVGTYTSLTWTGANPEYWNGFTFGVTGLASTTTAPEPATWGTLLFALLSGVPFAARRMRVKS
jgi:hypothetical protein